MEGLTNLVAESLARHGFDRPLDYRRLRWSLWFRCDSHHSLLQVPSKPGVFAVAEEIMDLDRPSSGRPEPHPRRMLAVTHFFEGEDMAFVLDGMLSQQNPLRSSLLSGRYFVRFVVIEDRVQRGSIASALNQWMISSAEKASGIGTHFASSLELTPATEYVAQMDDSQGTLFGDATAEPDASHATASGTSVSTENGQPTSKSASQLAAVPHLNSGAAINIHCPSPFPSGF
jgi:hypothetical protein